MTLEYATKARMIRNVARHSTTTAAAGATTTVAGSINDPMNNKNNDNIINYNKHGSNSNSNNNMFLMNNTQSAILREKMTQRYTSSTWIAASVVDSIWKSNWFPWDMIIISARILLIE